MREMKMF